MIENQPAWESPAFVTYYVALDQLFAPEATVLAQLRGDLPSLSVLDIGVGAGRTTAHLAGLAKNYVGIDYSRPMIDACRARFATQLREARFEVCDVRDMRSFPDSTFDVVLFSFNGLDNLGFDDRQVALHEIRRVLQPHGTFYFTTHNLEFVERPFRFTLPPTPRRFLRELRAAIRTWRMNRARRAALPSQRAVIPHYIQGRRLDQGYVTHAEQSSALRALGARELQLLATFDGSVIADPARTGRLRSEPWLCYLCRF